MRWEYPFPRQYAFRGASGEPVPDVIDPDAVYERHAAMVEALDRQPIVLCRLDNLRLPQRKAA